MESNRAVSWPPILFSIFFTGLVCHGSEDVEGDIYLCTRSYGSPFNLVHLRDKNSNKKTPFSDNIVLTAHSEAILQFLLNNMARACSLFSLMISVTKTVILSAKYHINNYHFK
uniref:Secreted protein n=1 Tax=Arion vulgaris TaxID=1028688 RepID=A0A0B6ZBF4_9EUPU